MGYSKNLTKMLERKESLKLKLKSNRGITLSSLVIYIIGLVVIVGVMGTFIGYFNKNLNEVTMRQNAKEQYSKFLAYLTKDVNNNDILTVQAAVGGQDCLIFKYTDGTEHQYIYQNETIYYLESNTNIEKKIVLCDNVSSTTTNIFSYVDGKIVVNFNMSGQNFTNSFVK